MIVIPRMVIRERLALSGYRPSASDCGPGLKRSRVSFAPIVSSFIPVIVMFPKNMETAVKHA